MTKKPNPTQRRKRDYMDSRTHEEEEPPITDEQAFRELGFDFPPNAGDREDFQD